MPPHLSSKDQGHNADPRARCRPGRQSPARRCLRGRARGACGNRWQGNAVSGDMETRRAPFSRHRALGLCALGSGVLAACGTGTAAAQSAQPAAALAQTTGTADHGKAPGQRSRTTSNRDDGTGGCSAGAARPCLGEPARRMAPRGGGGCRYRCPAASAAATSALRLPRLAAESSCWPVPRSRTGAWSTSWPTCPPTAVIAGGGSPAPSSAATSAASPSRRGERSTCPARSEVQVLRDSGRRWRRALDSQDAAGLAVVAVSRDAAVALSLGGLDLSYEPGQSGSLRLTARPGARSCSTDRQLPDRRPPGRRSAPARA